MSSIQTDTLQKVDISSTSP